MGGSRWLVGLIVTLGVVIGSGAGTTAQSPSPSLSPVPTAAPTTSSSPAPSAAAEPEHPPFAQELIERALAAGSIDYPTSLLYRAYALFGDERLPDEFLGAGSVGDDGGLPGEVTLSTDSLPPAIANDLEPFFLRPTDPSSLFHQGAEGLGSVSLAQTDEGTDLTPEASAECTGGWLGLPSTLEGVTLKVWAACDGSEQADASSVLAYAESLWTPMTTLMGVPRPDNGSFAAGGDGAIDIWGRRLSRSLWCRP